MKRALVFILCMLLVMSGCGPATKVPDALTPAEQKNAQSSTAQKITPTVVVSQGPSSVEDVEPEEQFADIQITAENWHEYFDLVEYEEWQEEDSVAYRYSKGYRLVLKDEYVQKLFEDEEDTESNRFIAIVKYSYHTWNVTVDYDKREYKLGEMHRSYEPSGSGGFVYNDTFTQQCDALIVVTKEKPYEAVAYGSFSKNLPINDMDEILEVEIVTISGTLRIEK